MMKYTFLLLLFAASAHAQQSTLHGTVAVFNSQFETGTRQYVANAQVEEDFGKSQATVTTADGSFSLPLIGIKDQEKVFYSIRKKGFEVVNADALQAIAGQTEQQRVFMAVEGKIAENKLKYYRINREAAEKALTEKLLRLENEISAAETDQTRLKQLQEEYANLQAQFEKIEEMARDIAERYARTNLDDVSSDYQRAFRCFQRGQLDSALLIFNVIDLNARATAIISEQNRNADLATEYTRRDSEKNKSKRATIDALRFKAHLHEARFEFDRTEESFQLLLRLDSNNIDNIWEFANFQYTQNQTKKSIFYYKKCLLLTQHEDLMATLYNNLGAANYNINNMFDSESMYLKSIDIYERLVKNNPELYEPELARTMMNFGNFYASVQKMQEALQMYLYSLKIYERLAKMNPSQFENYLAATILNLGVFYSDVQMMPESEKMYLRSLGIYKHLAKSDPEQFEPYLAATYGNLGVYYQTIHMITQSEEMYLNALDIYQRLAKNNAAQYEPDLALTAMNLGAFYSEVEKKNESQNAYLLALDIYERFSKTNPAQFEPELARTLMNLGNFYFISHEMKESQEMYLRSLKIREHLAENDPEQFEPDLAKTLNNLGQYYQANKLMLKAEDMYMRSLDIRERLAKNNPDQYEQDLASILNNIGYYWQQNLQFYKSYPFYCRALSIRQNALTGGQIYLKEDFDEVYRNMTVLRDSFEVKNNYKMAVSIQMKLSDCIDSLQRLDTSYLTQAAKEYYALSRCHLFAKNFANAELAAQRALELDPKQIGIYAYLIQALVLQGKYQEAQKTIQYLKNKIYGQDSYQKFEGIFFENLNSLEAAGITHPDIPKIRKLLQK